MNKDLVEALCRESLKQIHSLGLPKSLSVRDQQACVVGYFKALQIEGAGLFLLMNGREPDVSVVQSLVSASFQAMKGVLEREGAAAQSIVASSGSDAPVPPSPQGEVEQGKCDRDSVDHSGP